jgi:hypothetical protein
MHIGRDPGMNSLAFGAVTFKSGGMSLCILYKDAGIEVNKKS